MQVLGSAWFALWTISWMVISSARWGREMGYSRWVGSYMMLGTADLMRPCQYSSDLSILLNAHVLCLGFVPCIYSMTCPSGYILEGAMLVTEQLRPAENSLVARLFSYRFVEYD